MFTRKISFFVIALTLSLTAAPQVIAREFADIYTECGLGAMIAPKNPTVAAITNVTWDLGTTHCCLIVLPTMKVAEKSICYKLCQEV